MLYKIAFVAVLVFCCFINNVEAQQGCCSWHDGVAGCSGGRVLCNDGTLSPSCTCENDYSSYDYNSYSSKDADSSGNFVFWMIVMVGLGLFTIVAIIAEIYYTYKFKKSEEEKKREKKRQKTEMAKIGTHYFSFDDFIKSFKEYLTGAKNRDVLTDGYMKLLKVEDFPITYYKKDHFFNALFSLRVFGKTKDFFKQLYRQLMDSDYDKRCALAMIEKGYLSSEDFTDDEFAEILCNQLYSTNKNKLLQQFEGRKLEISVHKLIKFIDEFGYIHSGLIKYKNLNLIIDEKLINEMIEKDNYNSFKILFNNFDIKLNNEWFNKLLDTSIEYNRVPYVDVILYGNPCNKIDKSTIIHAYEKRRKSILFKFYDFGFDYDNVFDDPDKQAEFENFFTTKG